jgi:putative ABC transport system ATP-binding protein
MIEVMEVKKVFNMGRPNEFTAVDGVNLEIPSRRVTVLKGPSGSGKTTLLSLIACMARPTSGRIRFQGISLDSTLPAEEGDRLEVTSLPERFLTEIRRRTFGFIFQQFNLIRGITALENVMLPAYPEGEPHAQLKKRALKILALFNLASHAASKVEWLSGGEAQRVTIARALINNPLVLIADEPTAHLDSKLSLEFMDIIADLKAEGKTTIIASHDPLVFESPVVDRVIALRDGKIAGITA